MTDNHRAGLQQLKDRDAKIVSPRNPRLHLRIFPANKFLCVML